MRILGGYMNTAIFLTTRYKSTRLPGKHTMKINGHTVTDILIGRLKRCKIPIIMCIPNTPEDVEHMKLIAERNGIGFFAGEPTNIIKRHVDCCKQNNVLWVINCDGDDVLMVPEAINSIAHFIKMYPDSELPVRTTGLPLGLNIIAYPLSHIEKINYDCDTNWGAQILNPISFPVKFNYNHDFRLTLDYKQDLEVIKDILTNCKRNITVGGICRYLLKNPDVVKLNIDLNKEYFERLERLSK